MINVKENGLGRRVEEDAERYIKKFKGQMTILEKSPLAKVRPIVPYDYYSLGKQLEAFEIYRDLCEDDGTLSQLGRIPDVAFDVITVAYGTSPIGVCASVQPIDEERGTVYFKGVYSQTTKGTVTDGDKIFDPRAAADSQPRGFANACVTGEVLDTTTYGQLTYGGTCANLPVRPHTVTVTVDRYGVTLTAEDDGAGVLRGYDIQGTIDYTLGVVVIEVDDNPEDGESILIAYQQDLAAATDIPQIYMQLETQSVDACVYALKDTIGLEASYALRRRFGMIAEDELASDLISAINAELMNTLVWNVDNAHTTWGATQSYTWSNTAPTGVSYFEHKKAA